VRGGIETKGKKGQIDDQDVRNVDEGGTDCQLKISRRGLERFQANSKFRQQVDDGVSKSRRDPAQDTVCDGGGRVPPHGKPGQTHQHDCTTNDCADEDRLKP